MATKSLKEAYESGERNFKFNSKIYGDKSVREKLKKEQHKKCCYCELKYSAVCYGDVEHFRPKGGWKQNDDDPLTQPGYYWLAYDWSNLFLSCQLCNQSAKKNLFPLLNPQDRSRSHTDDLSQEKPAILHPSEDNPEEHIGFREEVPYAIDGSDRGKQTIDALDLNRRELSDKRYASLEDAKILLNYLKWLQQQLKPKHSLSDDKPTKETELTENSAKLRQEKAKLTEHFVQLQQDDAEFASMFRHALRDVVL